MVCRKTVDRPPIVALGLVDIAQGLVHQRVQDGIPLAAASTRARWRSQWPGHTPP